MNWAEMICQTLKWKINKWEINKITQTHSHTRSHRTHTHTSWQIKCSSHYSASNFIVNQSENLKRLRPASGSCVLTFGGSHPTIVEGGVGAGRRERGERRGRGGPPPFVALGMTIVNLFACRLQFLIAFCAWQLVSCRFIIFILICFIIYFLPWSQMEDKERRGRERGAAQKTPKTIWEREKVTRTIKMLFYGPSRWPKKHKL